MSNAAATIGEICNRFSSGKSIPAINIHKSGKYPVFGGNGLRGYTDTYNFEGECVIIGRQGAYCGNVRYYCGKAYMTEHAIIACVKPEHSTGYLAFKLSLMNLKQYQGQSAQPGLSVNTLAKVVIEMPEYDIQIKVFNILKSIDDKIQNNTKMIQEFELMAKTIYDYWFLQFDFPDKNGKPYKSSGGKMVWNRELKREMPDGWEVSDVEHFGSLSNGINYDKNIVGDKIYKIVNVRNISSATLLLDKSKIEDIQLSEKIADKFLLSENDILIARSGIPGAVRVLISDIKDTIYCGFIICLSLNSRFYRDYLVYMLKDYENTSATTSGGTIMQNVSQETIKGLCFPVPDERVMQLFNEKIDIIWKSMQQKMKENQELIALRDFLLPLLMNGQVGFKEE